MWHYLCFMWVYTEQGKVVLAEKQCAVSHSYSLYNIYTPGTSLYIAGAVTWIWLKSSPEGLSVCELHNIIEVLRFTFTIRQRLLDFTKKTWPGWSECVYIYVWLFVLSAGKWDLFHGFCLCIPWSFQCLPRLRRSSSVWEGEYVVEAWPSVRPREEQSATCSVWLSGQALHTPGCRRSQLSLSLTYPPPAYCFSFRGISGYINLCFFL